MLGIATIHPCDLLHLSLSGSLERAGAYPSYHRGKRRRAPWTLDRSPVRANTKRQTTLTLTFTPTSHLESSVSLTKLTACLWMWEKAGVPGKTPFFNIDPVQELA